MTNEERKIIALQNQMEAQKRGYERQIEMLKMQNSELKKQLQTQRERNVALTRANRVTLLSNTLLREEMMRIR